MPEHMTRELFDSLERITRVYPRDIADMVPSHNDLKPENILFDGNKAWLTD
jgi:thiamine kinase-like enzyme